MMSPPVFRIIAELRAMVWCSVNFFEGVCDKRCSLSRVSCQLRLRYNLVGFWDIRPRKSRAKIKLHFVDSTGIKTIFHMLTECEYGT